MFDMFWDAFLLTTAVNSGYLSYPPSRIKSITLPGFWNTQSGINTRSMLKLCEIAQTFSSFWRLTESWICMIAAPWLADRIIACMTRCSYYCGQWMWCLIMTCGSPGTKVRQLWHPSFSSLGTRGRQRRATRTGITLSSSLVMLNEQKKHTQKQIHSDDVLYFRWLYLRIMPLFMEIMTTLSYLKVLPFIRKQWPAVILTGQGLLEL